MKWKICIYVGLTRFDSPATVVYKEYAVIIDNTGNDNSYYTYDVFGLNSQEFDEFVPTLLSKDEFVKNYPNLVAKVVRILAENRIDWEYLTQVDDMAGIISVENYE